MQHPLQDPKDGGVAHRRPWVPVIIHRIPLGKVSQLFRQFIWVSLACWFCFVVERWAYNVVGIGFPYHRVPTMFLWLLALPCVGYWNVLVRSSFLGTERGRVAIAGVLSLGLAVAFLYASVAVFWTIAKWEGVQWW